MSNSSRVVTCHICGRNGPNADESITVADEIEKVALPRAAWRYDLKG